jgi:hypothetical protein
MRGDDHRNRVIGAALLILWIALARSTPTFAVELEVDELIATLRSQMSAATEQAKKDPMFKVKEIELTISYALEKKGEAGLKAYVITAGTAVGSQAVQTMKVTLTPLTPILVKEKPLQVITGRVVWADVNSGMLEVENPLFTSTGEDWKRPAEYTAGVPFKLTMTPHTKLYGVESLDSIKKGDEVWVQWDAKDNHAVSAIVKKREKSTRQ